MHCLNHGDEVLRRDAIHDAGRRTEHVPTPGTEFHTILPDPFIDFIFIAFSQKYGGDIADKGHLAGPQAFDLGNIVRFRLDRVVYVDAYLI